jgi:hypothetical protein
MIKWIYEKIHISLYISIYGFQNLSKLYSFVSMGSHYFLCKKNHSTKHFSKYNEFITIWYELWCLVLDTSKFQYVMVTQNLFMKFIYVIISHVIYFLYSFSYIIHSYFVPWPMIDNPTSCDKIMYPTLVCFHLFIFFYFVQNLFWVHFIITILFYSCFVMTIKSCWIFVSHMLCFYFRFFCFKIFQCN